MAALRAYGIAEENAAAKTNGYTQKQREYLTWDSACAMRKM